MAAERREKKRKKRPETEGDEAEPRETDADDEAERDVLADDAKGLPGEGTPDGDALREAHVAFAAGDYRSVRERCKALEAKAEDPAVREAAAALRARVAIDPIQVVVLSACAAVVFAIVYQWIV